MRMRELSRLMATVILVSLSAVACLCAPAYAGVIDDFETALSSAPNPLVVNSSSPTVTDTVTGAATSSIIGGARISTITYLSGAGDASLDVLPAGGGDPGELEIVNGASDPLVSSRTELLWNANAAGLNADLTQGGDNAFNFAITFMDQNSTLRMDLVDTSANNAFLQRNILTDGVITNPLPIGGDPVFYYSQFTADPGFSFSAVSSIKLTITGAPALDLLMDDITTTPEPSTFGLLIAACLGVFVYRRHSKNHEKAKKPACKSDRA